ncbi:hypothetical protein GALL_293760 [mine drainage metagenome]|uniref:Uncharacterized protein n=1 Tax=mine drainage metagenome TaxID=410659 RepID=A0A1J5QZN7_9ZZZZ
MAADAAGEGKLLEELAHAVQVLALVGIHLAVGAFQIHRPKDAGCAVSGSRHENRIQIVFVDQAVHVDVGECQPRTGSPVPEQAALDVFGLQGLFEQGIVAQVDHACRQVVAGTPVGIDVLDFLLRQGGGQGAHVLSLLIQCSISKRLLRWPDHPRRMLRNYGLQVRAAGGCRSGHATTNCRNRIHKSR